MKSFNHKVAAITGAGSGMGRALALLLAKENCHLALSDIDETNLAETAQLIEQPGIKVTLHPLNVANKEDVFQFAADVVESHGKVNLIFNNAGVSVTDTAEHMTYADFEWLMNINFWGVVHGTRAFLPYLRATDDAHIVNTSSIFGTIAVPTQSAYNASKFAVRGYTYALRQELLDTHINVSCVQPGGVKTNIVKSSRFVATDNNSPTKEEAAIQFESMAGLTSEQAAAIILKGVRKNKAQILVGKDAVVAAILERLAPTGYQRLIGKLFDTDEA